jgi:CheY-like chemotaxis protein
MERKEFVELWVMRWAEILQIRSSGNDVSPKGANLYHQWLDRRISANEPVDVMVRDLLTASGGTFENPPATYFQLERNNLKLAENVAQAFLGMRIQCAQCHNHPFDRWTMDDYYGFVSFFTGMKRGNGAEPHMLETNGNDHVKPTPLVSAPPQIPLVLVVDDSITVRRVTQRLLQREGFRVVMAADGLQALERLQDELPAVVLSDIEMPRMDGFDLARNIRGDARLAKLPIVMITSRIAQKHRDHALALGVNHYLGKPYSETELIGLIRNYCPKPALV